MKKLNISWLNDCDVCGESDYTIVSTNEGNESWLYEGDTAKCPSCGACGWIRVEDECASVEWEEKEDQHDDSV